MGARASPCSRDDARGHNDMIRIDRGQPDEGSATGLAALEARALAEMRRIVATENREPTSDDIDGFDYKIAGDLLWRRQGRKCAYCEHSEQRKRNDVEHFRPKTRANRGLFHPERHGYWWLAWRWGNLLFACRNCNQTQGAGRGKLDSFPLDATSGVLVAEDDPYGAQRATERPLIIDPSEESGIDHIEFRRVELVGKPSQWRPFARNGSLRGDMTIWLLGLDRDDLLDDYNGHVDEEVKPRADAFDALHPHVSKAERVARWREIEAALYRKGTPFIGLSYDALRFFVPDSELTALDIARRVPR